MERLRSYLRWRNINLFLATLVLIALGAVFGPIAARGPRVVQSSPTDGVADANPQAGIQIVFSQWVRPDSVRDAIAFDPPIEFTVDAPSFPRAGATMVIIKPQGGLRYGASYRMTLNNGVRNLFGRTLDQPLKLAFATVPYVTVAKDGPEQDTREVPLHTPILVEFGAPVVPAATIAAAADDPRIADTLPQPLMLKPPAQGIGRWLSPTLFGFYPSDSLHAATTYIASVPTDVTADGKIRLEQPMAWSFTTAAPLLAGTRPFDGATEVPATGEVEVRLEPDVDVDAAGRSFSLRESTSGATVQGAIQPSAGGFLFKPASPLQRGARYEASLAPGITSRTGAKLNGSPLRWSFSVIGDLVVAQVEPPVDTTEVLTSTRRISVRFNHPVVAFTTVDDQKKLPRPLARHQHVCLHAQTWPGGLDELPCARGSGPAGSDRRRATRGVCLGIHHNHAQDLRQRARGRRPVRRPARSHPGDLQPADRPSGGTRRDHIAPRRGHDPWYVGVWRHQAQCVNTLFFRKWPADRQLRRLYREFHAVRAARAWRQLHPVGRRGHSLRGGQRHAQRPLQCHVSGRAAAAPGTDCAGRWRWRRHPEHTRRADLQRANGLGLGRSECDDRAEADRAVYQHKHSRLHALLHLPAGHRLPDHDRRRRARSLWRAAGRRYDHQLPYRAAAAVAGIDRRVSFWHVQRLCAGARAGAAHRHAERELQALPARPGGGADAGERLRCLEYLPAHRRARTAGRCELARRSQSAAARLAQPGSARRRAVLLGGARTRVGVRPPAHGGEPLCADAQAQRGPGVRVGGRSRDRQ